MRPALLLTVALLAGCAAASRRVPPQEPSVRYPGDLGPETIDVSGYPEERRRQYAVYARVCSSCHSLARSLNSPPAGRDVWERHVLEMRARSAWTPTPEITPEEAQAVVDFLDYQARAGKTR